MIDPPPLSGGGTLGEIPPLRLPRPERLFARRAERFASLAAGHTLAEYLEFLARLSRAQATAWTSLSLEGSEKQAPLDAAKHPRGPEWRRALEVILGELSRAELPADGRAALRRLGSRPAGELEGLADRVLANAAEGADLAAGPFAAAALQVYFTALAGRLSAGDVPPARDGCPACGSLPVAAVVLGDDKLRYLECSLCATQWHHTRVRCTACHGGEGIAYYALEGERAAAVPGARAAKAEACPACKVYTKIFYVERDPALEPAADDVATLGLDLLMAESGWARHGVNLFLLPGEDATAGRPSS
jgi:FdhE protein